MSDKCVTSNENVICGTIQVQKKRKTRWNCIYFSCEG